MDHLAAEEEQREQHQQRGQRGHQGARQGLVDGDVEHVRAGALAQLAEVLADAVVHHDGVVQRVADHRQDRRQHRQVELHPGQREEAEGQDHVVLQRDDGAEGEAVLEAQRHVDQDQRQRVQHRQPAVVAQLLAHLRPHVLDPMQPHAGQRTQRRQRPVAQRALLAAVRLQAHQHIAGGAEVLHHGALEAAGGERGARRLQLHRLGPADLDQGAALEVDAEVQPLHRERARRQQQQRARQQPRLAGAAHEVDGEVRGQQAHVRSPAAAPGGARTGG